MDGSGSRWVARYAAALGLDPPNEDEVASLLALAGTAAHASERTAAPLSTWLAGRAGLSAEEARRLALRLAGDEATTRPAAEQ